MDIPQIIKFYVDSFNEKGIGTVRPVEVRRVEGLLGLVATANVLGHEREIFVSNEECVCMAFIGGDNPVEREVWRALRDDVVSIWRDHRIHKIMDPDEKTGT